jgi:hypothetical protein
MCETDPVQSLVCCLSGEVKQKILAPDGFACYGFIRLEEIIR